MAKFLLVGTQFAPGAAALLAKGLPQHAEVVLIPEPDNPYDALAVKVALAGPEGLLRGPELEGELANYALTVETLSWPFVLGHLGASRETKAAKRAAVGGVQFLVVAEWHNLPEATRTSGRLVFEGFGAITVEVRAS